MHLTVFSRKIVKLRNRAQARVKATSLSDTVVILRFKPKTEVEDDKVQALQLNYVEQAQHVSCWTLEGWRPLCCCLKAVWVAWAHVELELRKIDYQCGLCQEFQPCCSWKYDGAYDTPEPIAQCSGASCYQKKKGHDAIFEGTWQNDEVVDPLMRIWSTHSLWTSECRKLRQTMQNEKVSSWPAKSNVCRVITSQLFQNSPKSTLNFKQLAFERGSIECHGRRLHAFSNKVWNTAQFCRIQAACRVKGSETWENNRE